VTSPAELPSLHVERSRGSTWENDSSRTIDELRRKARWTVEDARVLVGFIRVPTVALGDCIGPDGMPQLTQEQREALLVHSMASAGVSERYYYGFPIEENARVLLIDALLAELESPIPDRRVVAISSLVQAGLARDPVIRARIEAMKSDPVAMVAANAVRQLKHFDDLEAVRSRERR